MIKIAPRTPKAGSIFVARTMGAGVGDTLADGVIVAVRVIEALKVVGTTVVIDMLREPDLLTEVVATELVVSATVTLIDNEGFVDAELPDG